MAVAIQENRYRLADGTSQFYRLIPGNKTDFFVTIIHGFAEHSGRYDKLMRCFAVTGRAVLAYDLRGHGRSDGPRGVIDEWPQFWNDFKELTNHLRQSDQWPCSKTVVVGHSLGGLIALEGVLRDAHEVVGLILSSPCFGLKIHPWLKLMNSIVAKVAPRFEYDHPVKPEALSRDLAIQKKYASDELILKKIRSFLVHEMIFKGEQLKKQSLKIDIPLWVLAAGNEAVVDLNQTLVIYAQVDAPFKKLKIFELFRHEIFNELGSEIAYDTALLALEQISKSLSSQR